MSREKKKFFPTGTHPFVKAVGKGVKKREGDRARGSFTDQTFSYGSKSFLNSSRAKRSVMPAT